MKGAFKALYFLSLLVFVMIRIPHQWTRRKRDFRVVLWPFLRCPTGSPKLYLARARARGRPHYLYSVEFRELMFSETVLPVPIVLGNTAVRGYTRMPESF
jgi:hypothetical protein